MIEILHPHTFRRPETTRFGPSDGTFASSSSAKQNTILMDDSQDILNPILTAIVIGYTLCPHLNLVCEIYAASALKSLHYVLGCEHPLRHH
jgi:hypothetical protein